MPRFKATVEFYENSNSVDNAKNSLEALLNMSPILRASIKSIEKISITHEEAIRQIKKLIDEESTYGCADASKIKSILERVI
jgi:hypothetical protein